MTRETIVRAVRQHIWGPVGSVILHVFLVLLLVRVATSGASDRGVDLSIGIVDVQPPRNFEALEQQLLEIAKVDEAEPPVVEEMPVDAALGEQLADADSLSHDAGAGPGESLGFGSSLAGLSGLDVAEDVGGLLTMRGLFAGRSPGGSGSGVFGYGKGLDGDLLGTMYDLKRDANGQPRTPDYLADIRHALAGRLGPRAFDGFYRITNRLYLSHLHVPVQPAENGPAEFGVKNMEPRNWVIHYNGSIRAPEAGRFRFVGMFDDLLMVMIDGQCVLEFLWTGDPTPWTPTEYVDQHPCFAGRPLVYGDWIDLSPGKPHRIDILVGEHPGGKVGGVLMVQQEGRHYERTATGRPVLPVFTVQMLTPDERRSINSDPAWLFENPAPVFGGARPRLLSRPRTSPDDVKVDVI